MAGYDAIVIGGGHNGLVNGAYLARAGLRTLILERRHLVGGAAITEEVFPGFRFTTFSYALSLVRPQLIAELDLVRHGFSILPMPYSFAPKPDGDYLLLGTDPAANRREIARHSARDAEAYDDYEHVMDGVYRTVAPLLDMIPPNLASKEPEELARLAELGAHLGAAEPAVLHTLVRLLTGSAAELLDDWFATDLLKGLLASGGIIGSNVGPRSPGSGLVMLYHGLGEMAGEFDKWVFHEGGNGAFTQVLARAARSFGAEIRTEAAVARVLTADGRATGVALADGSEVAAPLIVSALDPRRTFLELVEPTELPDDLVAAVRRMRFDGTSAKVNFALDGLPRYPGLDGDEHFRGFVNVAPSIDYLEVAWEDARAGRFSRHPYLDACVQSVIDPGMAPPGKHVMSCFVQYAPYHLDGHWDDQREALGDTVQATLESHFPGFGDLVLHRQVVTPLDIERTIGLSEGNIFAGELLAPQMFFFRPAPGWNQYRTPVAGYYQCGSGTHPGGCVTGAPGRNAARQILADRGTLAGAATIDG